MRWLLPEEVLAGTTAGELAIVLILGLLVVPVLIVVADAMSVRRALRGEVESLVGGALPHDVQPDLMPMDLRADASWPGGADMPSPKLEPSCLGSDGRGVLLPQAPPWPYVPAPELPADLLPAIVGEGPSPWPIGMVDVAPVAPGYARAGPYPLHWPAWCVPAPRALARDALAPPVPATLGAAGGAPLAPEAVLWGASKATADGSDWHLSPLLAASPDRQPTLLLANGCVASPAGDASARHDDAPTGPVIDPSLEPTQ